MKVLQIVHGFPPRSNAGAEKYTYNLSKALSGKHEVHVLYPGVSGSYLDINTYSENSIFRHEICVSKRAMGLFDGIRAFLNFETSYVNADVDSTVENFIKELKPDLIHFQQLINISTGLIDISVKLNIPCVYTLHDFWFICPTLNLFNIENKPCEGPEASMCKKCWIDNRTSLLSAVFPKYPKLSEMVHIIVRCLLFCLNNPNKFSQRQISIHEKLLKINKLIAPSSFMYSRFIAENIHPSNIVHLENGYDSTFFEGIRKKSMCNKLVFAFVGRISYVKGVRVLLEAFLKMPEGAAELRVYGHCEQKDKYVTDLLAEASSRSDIKFLGYVEDVKSVFMDIDILIFPSLWYENCPLSLAEAKISNTPVIASNIGAIPEFVEDQINGLLFKPGDAQDLYKKIQRFLIEPELLEKLSSNVVELPIKMQEHAKDIEKVYMSVLAR